MFLVNLTVLLGPSDACSPSVGHDQAPTKPVPINRLPGVERPVHVPRAVAAEVVTPAPVVPVAQVHAGGGAGDVDRCAGFYGNGGGGD